MRNMLSVLLAIVAIALVGCSQSAAPVVSPTSTPSSSSLVKKAATAAATATPAPHVGTTLALKTNTGISYTVQLKQVVDPAQAGNAFFTPDAGKRFVAAVFVVTNTSSKPLNDDADNDATLVGSDGQTYTSDLSSLSGCTDFNNGGIQLAVGESSTGCVAFQVPTGVTVTRAKWIPSSGFANDFGEWGVP